ncbi:hypothetical protein [uncultured Flavobacterium sp.]|uniref:hypothetical protein n=1 Tax=uncultured Flavobacterium sp. TaxID=165435 RepID=UPI0025EBD7A5|nr:hypothetical protein [uncultured Flavobacterium sp.]
MKKILLAVALLTGLAAFSQSANGALDTVLLTQADAMGKAFVNKDYEAFIKYSHPVVITMMGGHSKMLADTQESFKAFEEEGITFLNVTFSSPSKILESEGELQATFTEMIEMKVPGGKLTAYAKVIALSQDNGANWYFIDCTDHPIEMMRKLIPSLHPGLVLPEHMDASFEADTKPGP